MKDDERLVTIGWPCGVNGVKTLKRALCSLSTQTMVDKCEVIVCADGPEVDKKEIERILKLFPEIPSKVVCTKVNGGPGVARQKILEECTTPLITYQDIDDTWYDDLAIEIMVSNFEPGVVMVEGIFAGETDIEDVRRSGGKIPRLRPTKNWNFSPWVFSRMMNVDFCKTNGITFSDLRTMEDSCFIKQIHMLCDGSNLKVKHIENLLYIWRNQEASITRAGIDSNENHVPYYNYFVCPLGAVVSSINAVRNIKRKNPFCGNIDRHIVDMFIQTYFSWIECSVREPRAAELAWFNAKLAFHEMYVNIEDNIDEKVLNDLYTVHNAGSAQNLVGIIPTLTFAQFLEKVKSDPYNGNEEYKEIISKFPQDCIDKCKGSGVLDINEGFEKFVLPDSKGIKLHPTK